MNKTVAFFIPYFWTPHIETDLELVHRHIKDGDEVVLFICESELPTCYSNRSHDLSVCNLCIGRRRSALHLTQLGPRVKIRNFVNMTDADLVLLEQYKGVTPQTREDLLAVRLGDCYIGRTIYNELCSFQNDIAPSLQLDADYVTKAIESAAMVYLSFKNNFAECSADIFYTFNGRFAIAQPSLIAAREAGITYAVHDRAGAMNRFWLVENQSLHSIRYYNVEARRLWAASERSDEEKYKIGSEWYEERVRDAKQSWFSFTSEQSVPLPDGFDPAKTNIVIFNSSEWEVAVMDDYVLRLYESQNEALVRIAKDLENHENIDIYLRVHPYLKGTNNSQIAFIESNLTNKYRNFHVIPAESPIKTYSLMRSADAVISFGSTTGAEAAYHGIPSILLGPAWYEDLDACFKPDSHENLVALISSQGYKLSEQQREQRKLEAIVYGYFSQESGETYTIFKQTDIFEIKYLGANAPGATVTNEPPSYADGLRKELEQRLELTDSVAPNPLASTVLELQRVADVLLIENEQLAAQVASEEARAIALALGRQEAPVSRRHRYVRKLAELKRRVGQRVRRLFSY